MDQTTCECGRKYEWHFDEWWDEGAGEDGWAFTTYKIT